MAVRNIHFRVSRAEDRFEHPAPNLAVCVCIDSERRTFSLDLLNYEPTGGAGGDVTSARPFDTKKRRSVWGLSKAEYPGLQNIYPPVNLQSPDQANQQFVSTHMFSEWKYGNRAQTEGGVRNNGYGQTFRAKFHLLYCILSSRAKKGPQL